MALMAFLLAVNGCGFDPCGVCATWDGAKVMDLGPPADGPPAGDVPRPDLPQILDSAVADTFPLEDTETDGQEDATALDGPGPDTIVSCGAPDRAHRLKLVVNSTMVSGTFSKMPLLVDLSVIPAAHGFWSQVQADGGDLWVTEADGATRLPLEVVHVDATAKAGELWFPGALKNKKSAEFYLYYKSTTGAATQPPPADPHGSQHVWDGNYVAVWHLTESGTGAVDEFKDSTANGLHGRGGNGTSYRVPTLVSSSPFGAHAQSFDAVMDQYIRVGNQPEFDMTSWLTVEGWVRFTSFNPWGAGDPALLTKRYAYRLGASSSSSRPRGMVYPAGSGESNIDGISVLSANTWYHLAQTFNGKYQRLYLDGALVQIAMPVGSKLNKSTSAVELGSFGLNSAHLHGTLDEIRISKSVRAASWLATQHKLMSENASWWTGIGAQESCP